jgi:intein/homing endonuclease
MGAIETLHKKIITRQAIPEGHVVKGSIVRPQYQYEAHKNIEILKSGSKRKAIIHATNYPKLELDLDFLPAAAESYHISPNPEDYIVVSLPIVTCSVPNRNLQCFPIEEVTHFDPLYGQMVYETFKKKPCHIDHCFAEGTNIRISDNLSKPIEDIVEGDCVLTHTNQFKKVLRKFENGQKEVTKIIPTGTLEEIYVTENHPMYVIDKRQVFGKRMVDTKGRNERYRKENFRDNKYQPHWRPVSDIYVGDYLCIPVNYGGTIKANPHMAFLAGLFLADGSYRKNSEYEDGCGLLYTLGSHEIELIQKTKDCLEQLGYKYTYTPEPTQGVDSIAVYSVELAKTIRSWCGEYSHTKHINGDMRLWDEESTKIMLGAYLSGDGCFDKKKKAYRIRSSSKDLLRDVQQAFAFIKIPVCIGIDSKVGTVQKRNTYYKKDGTKLDIQQKYDSGYVRIAAEFAYILKEFVTGKSFIEKENDKDHVKLIVQDNYIMTPIYMIQRNISQCSVYNLEIEEDHTYIANDVIVHNCNEDPTKAKGVHVDASMQYVPKYDLWKINVLTIWDRAKDPKLVKDILSKKRKGYSMGATVSNFICSVCGKIDNMDHNSCEHAKNLGSLWGENKRLAMQLCTGVCYFETSNLENEPADPTAYSEDIFV